MGWYKGEVVIGWFQKVFSISSYRKVASSSMSWLVAHFQIFRMLMKGKLNAYVLWPLTKTHQNWIVDQSTAHDFTVYSFRILQLLFDTKSLFSLICIYNETIFLKLSGIRMVQQHRMECGSNDRTPIGFCSGTLRVEQIATVPVNCGHG